LAVSGALRRRWRCEEAPFLPVYTYGLTALSDLLDSPMSFGRPNMQRFQWNITDLIAHLTI